MEELGGGGASGNGTSGGGVVELVPDPAYDNPVYADPVSDSATENPEY